MAERAVPAEVLRRLEIGSGLTLVQIPFSPFAIPIQLMLAAAAPEAFRPLAKAQILPATVRANHAIADGFLYARNSDTRDNMLVCVDLRP